MSNYEGHWHDKQAGVTHALIFEDCVPTGARCPKDGAPFYDISRAYTRCGIEVAQAHRACIVQADHPVTCPGCKDASDGGLRASVMRDVLAALEAGERVKEAA